MLYLNHIVQLGNMEMFFVSGKKPPNVAGRASLVLLSGFVLFIFCILYSVGLAFSVFIIYIGYNH